MQSHKSSNRNQHETERKKWNEKEDGEKNAPYGSVWLRLMLVFHFVAAQLQMEIITLALECRLLRATQPTNERWKRKFANMLRQHCSFPTSWSPWNSLMCVYRLYSTFVCLHSAIHTIVDEISSISSFPDRTTCRTTLSIHYDEIAISVFYLYLNKLNEYRNNFANSTLTKSRVIFSHLVKLTAPPPSSSSSSTLPFQSSNANAICMRTQKKIKKKKKATKSKRNCDEVFGCFTREQQRHDRKWSNDVLLAVATRL